MKKDMYFLGEQVSLGQRDEEKKRGERDRETWWGSHNTLIIGLSFMLLVWGVPSFTESEDSSCLLWLTDCAQLSSGGG